MPTLLRCETCTHWHSRPGEVERPIWGACDLPPPDPDDALVQETLFEFHGQRSDDLLPQRYRTFTCTRHARRPPRLVR
jgi:hypothetical protein